jgi:hypothetical protein
MRDCNAYWLFYGPISTSLFENPMGDSPLSLAKLTSSSNFNRLNPRAETLEYLLIGEVLAREELLELGHLLIGEENTFFSIHYVQYYLSDHLKLPEMC